MRGRIFAGLLLCASLAACAAAGGGTSLIPLWKDFQDHPKGYLGDAAPRSVDFLAPPPAEGGARAEADLAVYRTTRALEGSPRWRLAADDADVETPNAPGQAFDCSLGTVLDIERQPVLMRLLARTMADADLATRSAKEAYKRPRPFLADNGSICVAKEDWLVRQASYPSGHAAAGWAWALILAEMAPAKAGPVLKRGLQYGESRAVCGVHYLSDVEAGRAAGAAVVGSLRHDPAFQADFKNARMELQSALASGPRPAPDRCRAEAAAFATPAF